MKNYLLIYIILEMIIFILIGLRIGIVGVLLEVFFSAFIGIYLLKKEKRKIATQNTDNNKKTNTLSIIGCILIILPGILSDLLGILLQISKIETTLKHMMAKKNNSNKSQKEPEKKNKKNIIEGEYEIKEDSKENT